MVKYYLDSIQLKKQFREFKDAIKQPDGTFPKGYISFFAEKDKKLREHGYDYINKVIRQFKRQQKKQIKTFKNEAEEIKALEQEFENLINAKQEVKKATKTIKQLDDNLKKDVKFVDETEYKNYFRTFKEGVRKPNGKISKSVKKFFDKKATKIIEKNLPIEELIKMYQKRYRKDKSFVHGYLYAEADRDEKGKYLKDYNHGDINKIQWDSTHTKKYKYCLAFDLILKDTIINQYQRQNFYNDMDDEKQIINTFANSVKDSDVEYERAISRIQESDEIAGFKVLSVRKINDTYKKPIIVKTELKADTQNKGINTKYTHYMINLMTSDFKNIIQLNYNEYIQNNFRPNSCVLTAIINKYYDRFNKTRTNGKRYYKELTYDYLCELLELDNKPDNIGCTIERAIEKFFKRYEFTGIYVYDSYMKLDTKFIANPKNKDLATMRVMVKDGHMYELTDNIPRLKQVSSDNEETQQEIYVNSKYNIMNFKDDVKEYFAETESDIIKILKEEAPKENVKEMKIICRPCIKKLLFKLINGGYMPKVDFDTALNKIVLYLNNTMIQIIQANNNPVYGQLINYENLQEYQAYEKAYEKFYSSIVKKEYLSDYHPSVIEIDDIYKINNVCGHFGELDYKPYDGLDENKAYTQCLMSIKKIPIFNYFDVYRKYANEPVEDLSQYIIEVLSYTPRTAIVFPQKYTKTFGYILKQVDIKYKILYVRTPLNIEEVNFQNPVNELFNNKDISTQMKKAISNITTGLLEKKINKGELSKIFIDYNEAKMYADLYSGKMLSISQDDSEEESLFIVKIKEEKVLENGFLPVKEMIYSNQRLKLLHQYDKLRKLGLKVRGIKTDCIFYSETKERNSSQIIKSNFPMSGNIGEFKQEIKKFLPTSSIYVELNNLYEVPNFDNVITKTFENEYDTKTINEYLKTHNKVLIKGLYPGVGKSTLAKNSDNNALFSCPYNTLCQQLRIDDYNAITYSKLFGLVGSDEEMKNIKKFNIDEYNTIVFDEIFLYEPKRLKRVSELMNQYPEKHFIATGDCDQRSPVGFNNSDYLTNCMNVLFNDQILLKEIKRFNNEEDKKKMLNLKRDIFDTSLSIEFICYKYGLNTIKSMDEVNTKLNICLFNFRCDQVNDRIQFGVLNKNTRFEVGQEVICRKYERINKLVTNYKYRITKMKKQDVVITDEVDNIVYKITPQILLKHFKLPYAVTCDSVQGITKNEPITIFDSNTPYVDRKYLWTALTRVKKLDDITIYIHSKQEVERLTESRLNLYLKQKVESYKSQDKKAQRQFVDEEFVDAKWINEKFNENKYCLFCKKHYELYLDEDSNVVSNITVDRINNSIAHTKNNCQLCCHHCNITKGNRY